MEQKTQPFPSEELHRFQQWVAANPNGFAKWAYIRNELRAEDAVVLSTLFWPELIERDGMVLLREHFDEQVYRNRRNAENWDSEEYERMLNHIHLEDFFADDTLPSRSVLSYLGQALREMWTARLHCEFPDREFIVEFECCEQHQHFVVSFGTKRW
jgi:hypothetical protein